MQWDDNILSASGLWIVQQKKLRRCDGCIAFPSICRSAKRKVDVSQHSRIKHNDDLLLT